MSSSSKQIAFGSYTFHNVFGVKAAETRQKIIDFWDSLKALPEKTDLEERANQVVFVVDDENGNTCGVCTVYPGVVPVLGFRMYFFRCLVHPDHRQNHLAAELLLQTRIFLNQVTDPDAPGACKGLIVESENDNVNKVKNETVWPYSGMIYIGKSERGNPVRIIYFDGGHIAEN